MDILIRSYTSSDYEQVAKLYKQSELYGGQFDENRDARERLQKKIESDADAILIAEKNGEIVGTVSLIDDGRVAWLFRFCVVNEDMITAERLFEKAAEALRRRGHNQVLVYSPVGVEKFNNRYSQLGFNKGGDYTCFWKDI
jgi:N-acetylglutamate synthase-like GNAT family acetyltransferase